jgi:hypothetical protein
VDSHGPLVASCWTAIELRRLTDKLFAGRSALDDFALHAAVVTRAALRAEHHALQAEAQRAQQRLEHCAGGTDHRARAGAPTSEAVDHCGSQLAEAGALLGQYQLAQRGLPQPIHHPTVVDQQFDRPTE